VLPCFIGLHFWTFLLAARRSRRAAGYAIASVLRTMRASTHALRMPNAKEVFFMGLLGLPTHPPPSSNEVKNTSFLYSVRVFARAGLRPALASIRKLFKNNTSSKIISELFYLVFRVRDSSEKPATGVACEELQCIARPRSAAQGTRPKFFYHI